MAYIVTPRKKHETNHQTIHAELTRLLRQKQFAAAPQMSAFLRYIVTEALEGRAHAIKAYSVGVDALGKPDTFDAQNDPSVRVLALRLRKALAAAYASDQAPMAMIELKTGSYVPEFLSVDNDGTDNPDAHYVSGAQEHAVDADVARPTVSSAAMAMSSHANDLAPETNSVNISRTRVEAVEAPGTSARVIVMAMVTILFCALLTLDRVGASQFSAWMGSLERAFPGAYASLNTASPDQPLSEGSNTALPSILVMEQRFPSSKLSDASVLLSSTLVQDRRVQVSRSNIAPDLPKLKRSDYTILLDKYKFDGESSVSLQVISSHTGALIYSTSMAFDNSSMVFSNADIQQLERLARYLASPAGPVFKHYCSDDTRATSHACNVSEVVRPFT